MKIILLKSRYNSYLDQNYRIDYDYKLSNTERYGIFLREVLKINTDLSKEY